MPRFAVRRAAALVLFPMCLAPGPARSQGSDTPDAIALLRGAAARIESSTQLRVRTRSTFDVVQDDGRKIEFGQFASATIRRPNRFQVRYEGDQGTVREVYYDGSSVSMHYPDEAAYARFDAPDNLDDTLDYLELELGLPMPLADLFYSDLSQLGSRATSGDWVGQSRVIGWVCDQLSFTAEAVDYQVWIERGDVPLIRKVVITYKTRTSAPQFRAYFLEWDFEAEADDALFAFTPPEGHQRIPLLVFAPRPAQAPAQTATEVP